MVLRRLRRARRMCTKRNSLRSLRQTGRQDSKSVVIDLHVSRTAQNSSTRSHSIWEDKSRFPSRKSLFLSYLVNARTRCHLEVPLPFRLFPQQSHSSPVVPSCPPALPLPTSPIPSLPLSLPPSPSLPLSPPLSLSPPLPLFLSLPLPPSLSPTLSRALSVSLSLSDSLSSLTLSPAQRNPPLSLLSYSSLSLSLTLYSLSFSLTLSLSHSLTLCYCLISLSHSLALSISLSLSHSLFLSLDSDLRTVHSTSTCVT